MTRPDSSPYFYGYVITAAGFMVWLVGFGTFTACFAVFLKPLIVEFGWNRADASIACSLSFITMALSGITMGWLTDRLGPRLVLTLFGSFLGISYLVLSQIQSLWQFLAAYGLIGGIGASTLSVPVMTTVSRWFVKQRGFMIGIAQTGISIGGLVFPPLCAYLILRYGWRPAYQVMGIIGLAGIILAGIFLRRDPKDMGQFPDGILMEQHPAGGGAKAALSPQIGFFEAVRTRQFWIIAGLYGSFGFCRTTFRPHLTALVQDTGFSLADGANVLAMTAIASMVGRISMGMVADRTGNRTAFAVSFSAMALIMSWGLVTRSLLGLYIFAAVFGWAWGAQAVLRFSITSETFGSVALGTVVGTLSFVESGAATVGSYFTGYVFDLSGSYQPAFWAGLLLSLSGVTLSLILKPIQLNTDSR